MSSPKEELGKVLIEWTNKGLLKTSLVNNELGFSLTEKGQELYATLLQQDKDFQGLS
jgi:hypothetical protein